MLRGYAATYYNTQIYIPQEISSNSHACVYGHIVSQMYIAGLKFLSIQSFLVMGKVSVIGI